MRRARNHQDSLKWVARHLYKRQYQTSTGDWSTLYYGIFKDWKGKRRKFPLGFDLKTAKDQLRILEADNVKKKDFDLEKIELAKAKTQGMTLEVWRPRFLDLVKAKKSLDRDEQHFNHLTRLLGSLPLSQINRPRIMEYKNQRLGESIMRYAKPVKNGAKVKISTINREIRCLLHALNLAVDEEIIENVPRIHLDSEKHLQRDRIYSPEEYTELMDASPRWLQRAIVGADEACLSRSDLLNLTRDSISKGLIKVKGGRAKTGVKQRVGISPLLQDVLDELETEYRRVPNTENSVFTRDGKPITKDQLRAAFEKAVENAGIKDFVFHDLRHCAKTRWAAAGLPIDVSDVGSGHAIPGMRGRYTNLTDQNIRDAFEKMFTTCSHGNESKAEAGAK